MKHTIPRWLIGFAGLAVVAPLLAACGGDEPAATATSQPTPTSPPATATATPKQAWEIEWDETLAKAQEEGEVVFFAAGSLGNSDIRDHLRAGFEDKFGIKVIFSRGSSRQNADKVLAERVAGKYTLDVWMGGTGTAATRLIPSNVLRPLPPLLFHPEILDDSAWAVGRLIFLDPDQTFLLAFAAAGVVSAISYNTDLVDPAEFVSYQDLLNPKWKGQIVIRDPRITGQSLISFYIRPTLGPEFVRRLLTEMDIVIAEDARSAVDGLGLGKWAICLLACPSEAATAKLIGLPVEPSLPHYMTEGGRLSAGAGSVYLVDTPKNPNAQKFFTNWWLSREGQILYQEGTGFDSLRIDIPKDSVNPRNRRDDDATYVWPQTRPDYATELLEVQEFSKEAMASVGR